MPICAVYFYLIQRCTSWTEAGNFDAGRERQNMVGAMAF